MRIESDGTHSFEVDLSEAVGQVDFGVEMREYEYGDGFDEQHIVDIELSLLWVDVRIINDDGEDYIPAKFLTELINEVKMSELW